MAFFDFLHKKEEHFLDIFLSQTAEELKIKELMIEHAIDLIAKTIAKSEIQVFRSKGNNIEKTVDSIYYKLNIRPNPNQDGTTFMYNLVAQLLRENEALVVKLSNDDLFIADRWETSEDVLRGKTYYDIVIFDSELKEYKLNRTFDADDAIYMSLGDNKIKKVLEGFYKGYAEMITASVTGFKSSHYRKYLLKLPTKMVPLTNFETNEKVDLKTYTEAVTAGLLEDKDSVTALSSSFDLEEITKPDFQKSDDSRAMIKDFGDKVAMAFNIPLDVYYGAKTERADGTNDFITFAVMPILNIIEDAFNAKLMSEESYLKGERFKFNTFTMKHFDIMDVANSLDKLFAIGWSHNDLREIIGLPIIEEEWADRHHVTKNYMDVDDILERGE